MYIFTPRPASKILAVNRRPKPNNDDKQVETN